MALITLYPDDAVQNLAFAIIRQACFDYVAALPSESVKPRSRPKDVIECELFFHSEFFANACPNIDPDWIMKTLRTRRNFRSLWRQKERSDVV